MKAQSGKTYAVIQNNRCHQIFASLDLPEWNEHQIQVVDVTEKVPKAGDVWNGSSFEPYIAPLATSAESNAKADAAIQRIVIAALPDVIDVLTKMVTGADKALLKPHDDAIKAEKAKKI